MSPENLIEFVEFADEDLVRSVTDDLVTQIFESRASDMNNSSVEEVVEFLMENGYSPSELASQLRQLGAIPESKQLSLF